MHIKGENLKAKGRYRLYGKESSSRKQKKKKSKQAQRKTSVLFLSEVQTESSDGRVVDTPPGFTITKWTHGGGQEKNRQHQAVDYDSKGRKIYDSDESRNLTANGRQRIITEMP